MESNDKKIFTIDSITGKIIERKIAFSIFPIDIWKAMFPFYTWRTILNLRLTCKALQNLFNNLQDVWKSWNLNRKPTYSQILNFIKSGNELSKTIYWKMWNEIYMIKFGFKIKKLNYKESKKIIKSLKIVSLKGSVYQKICYEIYKHGKINKYLKKLVDGEFVNYINSQPNYFGISELNSILYIPEKSKNTDSDYLKYEFKGKTFCTKPVNKSHFPNVFKYGSEFNIAKLTNIEKSKVISKYLYPNLIKKPIVNIFDQKFIEKQSELFLENILFNQKIINLDKFYHLLYLKFGL